MRAALDYLGLAGRREGLGASLEGGLDDTYDDFSEVYDDESMASFGTPGTLSPRSARRRGGSMGGGRSPGSLAGSDMSIDIDMDDGEGSCASEDSITRSRGVRNF